MPRITKKPEERKLEIIKTAFHLFSTKGYKNTTIKDIADQLNIAQGLCYRYFKSKQELFTAAANFYATEVVSSLQVPSDITGATNKLNLVVQRLLEYAASHLEFEANYNEDHELRLSQIEKLATNMIDTMVPIVQEGVCEGVFNVKNVAETTTLLVFGIIHLIHFNIPDANIKDHIRSFLPTIKDSCQRLLGVTKENSIGTNWNTILK